MTSVPAVSPRRLLVGAAVAALVMTGLGVVGAERHTTRPSRADAPRDALVAAAADADVEPESVESAESPVVRRVPKLPGGGTRVFGRHRFLVAYYGTAGTGSLGVLGETAPDEMQRRLRRAAQPFKRDGERIQSVYELIVTVADPIPGADGDFSHDIPPTACATTSRRRTATAPWSCWTSSRVAPTSSPWPSAGRGRWRTRGSGSRSTPSGGWGRVRCRAG